MDTNRMGISKMATSRMDMDINNRMVDISSSGCKAVVEMANRANSNNSKACSTRILAIRL